MSLVLVAIVLFISTLYEGNSGSTQLSFWGC